MDGQQWETEDWGSETTTAKGSGEQGPRGSCFTDTEFTAQCFV